MQKSIEGSRNRDRYRPGRPRKVNGGWNLSDILRDLVQKVCEDHGWTQPEFARQLNMDPSSIYRFLNGTADDRDLDLRLEFLTRFCARMGETPAELFARHPVFRPEGTINEQLVHARVAGALFAHEAHQLLPMLEELKFRGLMDVALNHLRLVLEGAKRS